MINKTLAAALALSVSFGYTQSSVAAENGAKPATVIIYRTDDSVKTSRLRPAVHVNASSVSRLDRNDVVVLEGEPGEYTLDTSMPGTEPLTLDLKPGATYYVRTEMKMRGARIYVNLVEVEEQVAKVQQPDIGTAI